MLALAIGLVLVLPVPAPPARTPDVAGHGALRRQLEELEARLRALPGLDLPAQATTMRAIARALEEHLRPQGEREERLLYPRIDARAACSGVALSAPLRAEHALIARAIDDLGGLALEEPPPAVAFVRRADRLIGLTLAHLEVEAEVLSPLFEAP